MSENINVTLLGHSSSRLNALELSLQDCSELDLTRKLLLEGVIDPLEDLPVTCGLVVLDLNDNWRDVLTAISSRNRRSRPPMILVGPEGNSEMMRHALKAGARDFQTHPVVQAELIESVRQIGNEQPELFDGTNGDLTVFIGAKGGVGSTSVACNLARALRQRSSEASVLLADFDLQYGNLPLYFDMTATTKLGQALSLGERMDTTLLDACLLKSDSGIDILATYSDQVVSPWEINAQAVGNLLNLIVGRYDHIVIDIPKHIDPVSFQAIERAQNIVIVMQQNLPDLRYARQIIGLLRDQGIANEKIKIVLNRNDKRNVVRLLDVTDAFENHTVVSVPNDYKRMSYCNENSTSILKKWRSAPVSKALVGLSNNLWPPAMPHKKGLFGTKLFSSAG